MGIASKFLNSVSGLYTTLNPITFSGVNDVIVVQEKDGTMKCSPFQVRFSKLRFHNMKSQIVHLYVNGKLTNIRMSITSQGDVFFASDGAPNGPEGEKCQESGIPVDISIESILEQRLTFRNREAALRNCMKSAIVYNNRVYSASMQDLESMARDEAVRDDLSLCLPCEAHTEELQGLGANKVDNLRLENLSLRIFAMQSLPGLCGRMYSSLAEKHTKIYNLLTSADHFAALIEKAPLLSAVFDSLINNRLHASVAFSFCLNNRIEGSFDDTFMAYLITEIESPEATVVRVEMPVGCPGNTPKCICRIGPYSSPHKTVRFYFPYLCFSRLFFEIRDSRNALQKIVDFLEKEHNKALGWNIFGKKQFLRRDIGFSLTLSSEELQLLGLQPGKNEITFKIGGMKRQLDGNIFLWDVNDKIVISDIDGTITKSDIRGHLYGFVGKDWTHTGVAGLFSRISRNGYKIVYLTARPLGQSSATRSYLRAVSQDSFSLPDGPVLLSPSGLFEAFYREVIIKKPEVFKIECLQGIQELFNERNPFIAGFGNRVSDVFAYKALSIPRNRIYTINPNGQLVAEYTNSLVGTYHTMNEFVDSIFPPIHEPSSGSADHGYSDFGWWKRY